MKVLMTQELYKLYTEGKSREYKEVAMNKELYSGFVRAVKSIESAGNVAASNRYVHRLILRELEDGVQVDLIEIDDTHYGNKK